VIGQPSPRATLETVQAFAVYSGTGYSTERLAELLPNLQSLMADIRDLWDVDVSHVEMALVLPIEAPEG
jgi:hypothetical protein